MTDHYVTGTEYENSASVVIGYDKGRQREHNATE